MGLFKEFKDDFSQAVNELVPGDVPEREAEPKAQAQTADNLVVDTIGENVDVASELSKLDGLLEHVEEQPQETAVPRPTPSENFAEQTIKNLQEEEQVAQMNEIPAVNNIPEVNNTFISGEVQDETSVITASTVLTGDLQSSGSFDIQGTINGNVMCNGKIVVTGTVNGNTNSSEFFADVAKVEGEISSTGTVKIGAGSVIIGNISAASAVIAGAVKGDIDVQGPVVVDTSAVIMGNIKSRSVQINNGAVIEGFCSQTYADIDVQGLFEGK
ncbi:polymer-forming cytoskeletal protein [Agathobacter sp.]|uniref:polymer-forming cytoskeletal protein n=1 Tax=Agathobacter sp. TaxID=2021311 RepID=UPI003FD8A680